MNQVPRGRGQFYLLLVLFFGPLLAAVLLYFVFPDFQPHARTNYGELIRPARPIPQPLALLDVEAQTLDRETLRGRWTFLYLGADSCDQACEDKLYQIRQIRTLLNEKQPRVQRVYLAQSAAALPALRAQLQQTHPDLRVYAEADAAQPLRAFFAAREPQALYLIDPLGNWLMVYPGAAESPGILKDIKKLLRISQIG